MATKSDMDRLGIFKEMEYVSIGDKYKSTSMEFNTNASKGRQMLSGGSKSRCATAGGYFTEFSRIFEKEAYSNVGDIRRKQRLESKKRIIGKAWMPPQGPKNQPGVGSCFGTFSGPIDHFSGIKKDKKNTFVTKKNFLTSPAKCGSGYGYVDVTLSKYPEYQTEKYGKGLEALKKENERHKSQILGRHEFKLNMHPVDYFDPNPFHEEKLVRAHQKSAPARLSVKAFKPSSPSKTDGGMKAGCFDTFPSYSSTPYTNVTNKRPVSVVNSTGKIFMPNSGPKSAPINSVLNTNIRRSMNIQNYKHVSSIVSF